MLFKMGLTKQSPPEKRINQQQAKNSEKYTVVKIIKTRFHKYFEYMCHRLFQDQRVVKEDSKDGKTEWFLQTKENLMAGIDKVRQGMHYVYKDDLIWKSK